MTTETLRAERLVRYSGDRPPGMSLEALRGSSQTRVWRAVLRVDPTLVVDPESRSLLATWAQEALTARLATWKAVPERFGPVRMMRFTMRFFAVGYADARRQVMAVAGNFGTHGIAHVEVESLERGQRMRGENP